MCRLSRVRAEHVFQFNLKFPEELEAVYCEISFCHANKQFNCAAVEYPIVLTSCGTQIFYHTACRLYFTSYN